MAYSQTWGIRLICENKLARNQLLAQPSEKKNLVYGLGQSNGLFLVLRMAWTSQKMTGA